MAELKTAAAPQPQHAQIPLRMVEKDMNTFYANAFRTNATPDEVIVDFGFNQLQPTGNQQAELLFQLNQRVIMNLYTAKRLAMTLGQVIRRHEESFGELELDANKRRKGAPQ